MIWPWDSPPFCGKPLTRAWENRELSGATPNLKCLAWNPAAWAVTSPLGDSSEHLSLRTAGLGN